MKWSLRIGRLFGIQVELHVTFLLFIVWIAVTRGLLAGNPGQAVAAVALLLLVFSCVLLHELGHALAARRYGIMTKDIILLPIGGVARLQRMPDKPQQEIVVAVAGPAVNVALALILLGVDLLLGVTGGQMEARLLAGGLVETLIAVNVIMLLFNLIPAFPMDGGRVLRAVLALKLPYVRATQIASVVGQGVALVFGVIGLFNSNFILMLIALFVFFAASEERALVRSRATLAGLPVRAAMLTSFHALDENEPLQRAVDLLMAGSQQDFPVMRGGVPVGVLTRADLARGLRESGPDATVGSIVSAHAEYADAHEPLEDAIHRMREMGRSALPVLMHGQLVGLVTLENVGDLLTMRDALRRGRRS